MPGPTTEKIRGWATALPEVTEKQHHLFKVPIWQVRGRTFLGMGRDESSAVFCIPEKSADAAAAADPEHAAAVRRKDARRSFLGLEATTRPATPSTIAEHGARGVGRNAQRPQRITRVQTVDHDQPAVPRRSAHSFYAVVSRE